MAEVNFPDYLVALFYFRLEVWPGYVTAISRYDSGVMLMSDISHKIMRSDNMYNQIMEVYERNPRGGRTKFEEEVKRKYVGSIVLTR